MPAPYDPLNFLRLLGIELQPLDPEEDPMARLTVRHDLVAGDGMLWSPVVLALADALCALGVNHHWPRDAAGFSTVDCSANFVAGAQEGDVVMASASPLHTGRSTQVWDAVVTNETTERLMASYRCTQLILY